MRLSIARFMPVSKNAVRRPRRFKTKYSDAWHIGSEVTIKDQGYRAACESRGIRVYNPTVRFLLRIALFSCYKFLLILGGVSALFTRFETVRRRRSNYSEKQFCREEGVYLG